MNLERVCFGCFQEKEPGAYCPHCGFSETEEQPFLALPLGTVLNGRYLTGKVLGVGGFGITYLGYDLKLEICVAIKEYMPSGMATRHSDRYSVALTNRESESYLYGMERFLDEARILAKLQNTPSIVSVQDYFKENNTAYFVMEYVEGMSLKAYLTSRGERISYEEALNFLLPIMHALTQVHAMNLLHRDISPDNIYISSRGESRLLDFGAARVAMGDGKSVSVILKHGYAPEEQYSSHGNQGPWTDVYAMGATFYRCITGVLLPDSVQRGHNDSAQRPSVLGARLPVQAENAIMKAVAPMAKDRFPNMESFIDALMGASSPQTGHASSQRMYVQGGSETVRPQPQQPQTQQSGGNGFVAALRRSPALLWSLVCSGALLLALCIVLPIALSIGREQPVNNGGGGGNVPSTSISGPLTPPSIEETVPPQATGGMVERDLGPLNASIWVPDDYTVSSDGFTFVQGERGYAVEASFIWIYDSTMPLYSVDDVERWQENIVASYVQTLGNITAYQILDAGADSVGGQDAYQIYFEAENDEGVAMELIILAVNGQNDFGCYFLVGAYPKDDEAGSTELYAVLSSLRSKGTVDTGTHRMFSSEQLGRRFLYDASTIEGNIVEKVVEDVGGADVPVVLLYPLEGEDLVCIEVQDVDAYAETAEEALDFMDRLWENAGAVLGNLTEETIGNNQWKAREISISSDGGCYFVSEIDGRPVVVAANFVDETSAQAVIDALSIILVTIQPL